MKQIIPCNVEMYAVYDDGENGELKDRIIAFGLDGEGYFRLTAFGTKENSIEAIKRIKNWNRD